jgi:O-antigen biosynthesis protein WbqP
VHKAREISGVYSIRPGITGLAQVKGRNRLSDEKKVALDEQYLNDFGFAQDVRILGLTALGVVFRRDINV